jgi:hypothetical protein
MPCPGWPAQLFRGENRMNVYLNTRYAEPIPAPTTKNPLPPVEPTKEPTKGPTTSTVQTTAEPPAESTAEPPAEPTDLSPRPTILPSVYEYGNPRCFVDGPSSRVLGNSSSTENGSNGMTVEKCVEQAEGWRYAGVEFGG